MVLLKISQEEHLMAHKKDHGTPMSAESRSHVVSKPTWVCKIIHVCAQKCGKKHPVRMMLFPLGGEITSDFHFLPFANIYFL